MDEPIDAESLAAAVSEAFGREVSPESIRAFFRSLEQKFLVDTPLVREKLEAMGGQTRKGREQNLLYWKLASFDPGKIFDWLQPRTKWAFTRSFQVIGVLAILTGFEILFTNWDRLRAAVPGLFSVSGLMLIMPAIFLVVTIHEFSHGLTCRHFGGQVHEVGFMLIYFQPAFYCDVSDSWLFPSRRNRMLVTLAGGYAQLIVWGLCAIVWRVTETNTFINQATLAVVLYSGVQSLVNFNPLIKLDGYYMLSDYLEIPNLRAKAAKTVFGWVSGAAPERKESRRERRAQLIYGTLALLFSTGLLLYVYTSLYTWSATRYGLAGLIGFAMFSTYTLRKTATESISGIRAFATRVSLKKFRNLGIAATLAAIMIFGRWELKIPAEFKVVAQDSQAANAETDGIIVETLVHQGSEVRKGEVLARMRDPEKQEKISDIIGQIAEKRSTLNLLLAGTQEEKKETKRREIRAKEVQLANARRNQAERARLQQVLITYNVELEGEESRLQRARQLMLDGAISQENYERIVTAVKVLKNKIAETQEEVRMVQEREDSDVALRQQELEVLQSELKQLEAPPRREEVQRQQEEIRSLEKRRDLLDRELARTDITAPIDGVVVTPLVDKKLNQRLEAGMEFCLIVDIRRVKAEMLVPEKEMADVEFGLPVWLKLRGFPHDDISGRVDFIDTVVQTTPDNRKVVVVRSEIANDNKILKPEMTGWAHIYGGERRIIELMTRRLVIWIKTEFLPNMWP
jgi:multidrug resistance efflux pump